MPTTETNQALTKVFSELVDGANDAGGAFVLNNGDIGLLGSLDKLSAADASRSVNDGATIAAHAEHLRYGLSLMNLWASQGGDPISGANWEDAWKISEVDPARWDEIRSGLREEIRRWLEVLDTSRSITPVELSGRIGISAHLAYHLGAIRQIDKSARGPKEQAR